MYTQQSINWCIEAAQSQHGIASYVYSCWPGLGHRNACVLRKLSQWSRNPNKIGKPHYIANSTSYNVSIYVYICTVIFVYAWTITYLFWSISSAEPFWDVLVGCSQYSCQPIASTNFGITHFTRSKRCCNLVKYLYPVIYWRLFKLRVGVRVGDRSYNMHEITIVVSCWNC